MRKVGRGCLLVNVCVYINNLTTVTLDVGFPVIFCDKVGNKIENPLYEMHTIWAMYILRRPSSWGTSRICPSWSPSEHLLTPALSPFGACVRSHAVRRRLFIVLITAAHISPNVFSLRMFPSNLQFIVSYNTRRYHAHILYITFTHTFTSFILYILLISSFLPFFIAGWLPSAPCVWYSYVPVLFWQDCCNIIMAMLCLCRYNVLICSANAKPLLMQSY